MLCTIKACWIHTLILATVAGFSYSLLAYDLSKPQDLLWYSLESNDEAGVKKAYQREALLNLPREDNQELPLYYAFVRTNNRIIEYLLQHGADPNGVSAHVPQGILAMFLNFSVSPRIKQLSKIELLLQYKAAITLAHLQQALGTNQFVMFCLLLRYASKNNMLTHKMLKILLDEAFALRLKRNYWNSDFPLMLFLYGAQCSNQEQEHYYAGRFTENGQDKTLELAAEHGVLPKFLERLAEYQVQGLSIFSVRDWALRLLRLAVKGDNEVILEEILKKATCLTDEDKYIELKSASYDGKTALVKAFLTQGLSPNPPNSENVPALVLALSQRACKAARLLIKFGAYVNETPEFSPLLTVLRARAKCFKLVVLLLESGMDVPTLDRIREIFANFNSCPEFFSKALRLLLVYGCDFSQASPETKEWVERDFLENYTGIKPDQDALNAIAGIALDDQTNTNIFSDFEFIPSFRDISRILYLIGQRHERPLANILSSFNAPIPLVQRLIQGILARYERLQRDIPAKYESLKEKHQTYQRIKDMLEYHAQTQSLAACSEDQRERPLLLSEHTPPRACSFANTLAALLMS